MADAPSPPWKLSCDECSWCVWVSARGQRGHDQGSGYEAALLLREHKATFHATVLAGLGGEDR